MHMLLLIRFWPLLAVIRGWAKNEKLPFFSQHAVSVVTASPIETAAHAR
jgi:hypothetical protein